MFNANRRTLNPNISVNNSHQETAMFAKSLFLESNQPLCRHSWGSVCEARQRTSQDASCGLNLHRLNVYIRYKLMCLIFLRVVESRNSFNISLAETTHPFSCPSSANSPDDFWPSQWTCSYVPRSSPKAHHHVTWAFRHALYAAICKRLSQNVCMSAYIDGIVTSVNFPDPLVFTRAFNYFETWPVPASTDSWVHIHHSTDGDFHNSF